MSALYDVPVGDAWPAESLARLAERIDGAGLRFAVVESIPVHEDIKLGRPTRDRLVDNYCTSVQHMGALGVPVLCYNFMPVFDWTRTDLALRLPDGSTALAYDDEQLSRIDLSRGTGDLPGWATAYGGRDMPSPTAPPALPNDRPPVSRRDFLARSAGAAAAVAAGSALQTALPAAAWARVPGANDRLRLGVIGTGGRGRDVMGAFLRQPGVEVVALSDAWDVAANEARAKAGAGRAGPQATIHGDYRRVLDRTDVDAVLIAAPDHWHAPAAILALRAGKHVYVEKPCSHNPGEGELLVEAQRRHGRLVQMGSQQPSAPPSIEVVQEIRRGLIGRPYLARTWYANARDTIGRGKPAPVPAWLDYELCQGPAPRTAYRDNVVHYNWHWFHRWGTGEICNNGTHEIDFARWALGVDYPVRVTSTGGRYQFADDWEFPDAQQATFEFADDRVITWEGRSCNGFETVVYGIGGTAVVDRNGYTVYDRKGTRVVGQAIGHESDDGLNVRGGDTLTVRHVANFIDAVRTGAALNAPITEGHKSTLLAHLGNRAQQAGRALRTDPTNGHILGDADATKGWTREYAPTWQPTVA